MAKGTGCPSLVLANCKSVAVGFRRKGEKTEGQKGTEGTTVTERQKGRSVVRERVRGSRREKRNPKDH